MLMLPRIDVTHPDIADGSLGSMMLAALRCVRVLLGTRHDTKELDLHRSSRGRVRISLGTARRNPLAGALWTLAVALLAWATLADVQELRAWAVLVGLGASTMTAYAMTQHVINRLTQILAYFHDDVKGSTHDSGPSLRRVR